MRNVTTQQSLTADREAACTVTSVQSAPHHPPRRINLSINMEATGQNIKRLIQTSGYTVKDIMEITGITTEQAIYKWYSGKSIPSLEVQLILAAALGKSIEEILVIDGDFYIPEIPGAGNPLPAPCRPLKQKYPLNCRYSDFRNAA